MPWGELEECLDLAKGYLSFLPLHSGETPPGAKAPEGSGKEMDRILDILPENQPGPMT